MINISWQQHQLTFTQNGSDKCYLVSLSQYGMGQREGSFQTPWGMHQVSERIGDGLPIATQFIARTPLPQLWSASSSAEDPILGRILRLVGVEPGINFGDPYDSYSRYIYIHGSPSEKVTSTHQSHGCIRMRPHDMLDLFDRVEVGCFVNIGL